MNRTILKSRDLTLIADACRDAYLALEAEGKMTSDDKYSLYRHLEDTLGAIAGSNKTFVLQEADK